MSTVVFANGPGGGYGGYGGPPPGKSGKLPMIVFSAVALFFCSVCVAYVFNLRGLRDTVTWVIGFDPLSFLSPSSSAQTVDSAPAENAGEEEAIVSTDGEDVATDSTDAGVPDPNTGKCSDGAEPVDGGCPVAAAQSGKVRGSTRASATTKPSTKSSPASMSSNAAAQIAATTSKPTKKTTAAPKKSSSAATTKTTTGPSRPIATQT